jgi:glycosyltransferase involved in cell wall biosynthesis
VAGTTRGGAAAAAAFHSAVIASTGRPAVLADTVDCLLRQTMPPDEIILSIAQPGDVLPEVVALPRVRVLVSPRGSSVQRNRALDHVDPAATIVSFFDDDVELAPDHLARAQELFAREADVVMLWGLLVADGVQRGGLSRDEARAALRAHAAEDGFEPARGGARGALGGGMHVRRAAAGHMRFDERLALYGWQEDRDLAARCTALGRVGLYRACAFAHLGVPGGRVSGRRFGFAQVMNPVYLWRKGSIPAGDAGALCARAVARNALGTLLGEKRVDRAGRLRGNLAAVGLLLRRRIEPEHVAQLD